MQANAYQQKESARRFAQQAPPVGSSFGGFGPSVGRNAAGDSDDEGEEGEEEEEGVRAPPRPGGAAGGAAAMELGDLLAALLSSATMPRGGMRAPPPS